MWLHWKRSRPACDNWQAPSEEDAAAWDVRRWYAEHFYGLGGGTVHCSALDAHGNLACATTTSGHAFKLAGRVGDSPIPGAGFYVDNAVGAAGCIGHGEATLQNVSSFLAVEAMRRGASPEEAGREALTRLAEKALPSQCDPLGRPRYDVQMFLISRDGGHAGVSLWNDRYLAVSDASGTRREPCLPLFHRDLT